MSGLTEAAIRQEFKRGYKNGLKGKRGQIETCCPGTEFVRSFDIPSAEHVEWDMTADEFARCKVELAGREAGTQHKRVLLGEIEPVEIDLQGQDIQKAFEFEGIKVYLTKSPEGQQSVKYGFRAKNGNQIAKKTSNRKSTKGIKKPRKPKPY